MIAKTDEDIEGLKEIGGIIRQVLDEMEQAVRPGITTRDLDEIAGRMFSDLGATSAPKLAYDFPGYTCISVHNEAAHGIPGDRVLEEGQLVNIDVSAEKGGYWADSGRSMPVGRVASHLTDLCDATKKALDAGINAARAGNALNMIGRAVEGLATKRGYRIIDGLVGHGVGSNIHEPPDVHNRFMPNLRSPLVEGLVITIEPFLTKGVGRYKESDDGWTLLTWDGSPSAQYEHTLIITKGAPIIVT
ncbi:type I methionyl aminopeptidase [Sneathiella sp. P13V-1]|uniref:type I methionyl aminopeptidase n=1 Tax=Sneathiella sp. P13V-1 TaxID=2697366 RepID=UPI00187B2210|nr:type I methionyl aminopeptidase [Sneathiella sp. P13V-1]MBE7637838.1 type I methionyl aminopeptidase [Sneathiella sp. P13V-1]